MYGRMPLGGYLRAHGLDYAAFARLIDGVLAREARRRGEPPPPATHPSSVSRWARGVREPGLEVAAAIEDATRGAVPMRALIRRRARVA